MKNCIIYVRVSSQKQAEKELPIDSQIEKCKDHADSLGAKIDRVFRDDGISGRSDNRPGFQQALAYCENFNVDYFVCWSTSRFARNALDAKINKRRLEACATKISYVSVNIDEGDSGFIYEGILELFDEFYSRQISQDTIRSLISNAQSGYFNGGAVSVGFKAVSSPDNPKKKILVREPFEAVTIERAFELKMSGLGAKQISLVLNEEMRLNRGKKWHKGTVLTVLRNERYAGRTAFGKKTKEGNQPRDQWIIIDSHEPIISPALFDSVQERMDKETNKGTPEHGSPNSTRFFTGLLKCSKCNANMSIERAKGATKIYYYYNCKTKQMGKGCDNRRINSATFDSWLAEQICEQILTPVNLEMILVQVNEVCGKFVIEKKNKIQKIEAEVRTLELRNSRLYDILESSDSDYNVQDLSPRIRANSEKIRAYNTQKALIELEQAPKLDVTSNDVQMLQELIVDVIKTTKNPKKVREFFKQFITRIIIKPSEALLEYKPDVLVGTCSLIVPSEVKWLPLPDSNGGPAD